LLSIPLAFLVAASNAASAETLLERGTYLVGIVTLSALTSIASSV
jgi:hypothetical protein